MLYSRAPLVFTLLLTACLVTLAAEPATAPARRSEASLATQPVSEFTLRHWFADLADGDAVIRERAYSQLLGLTRQDLPGLRQVVEQSRPVEPAQAGALREAVFHVYLSGETYEAEPRSGFLGLLMPTLDSVEVQRDTERAVGVDVDPRVTTGVPVDFRIPGFCGFRALREGDVLLAIVSPAQRQLTDWRALSPAVRTFAADDVITFEVLRQGVVMKVPLKLDAFPLVAGENVWLNEILPARDAAAEAYWTENFAPLLHDRMSSLRSPDAPRQS